MEILQKVITKMIKLSLVRLLIGCLFVSTAVYRLRTDRYPDEYNELDIQKKNFQEGCYRVEKFFLSTLNIE